MKIFCIAVAEKAKVISNIFREWLKGATKLVQILKKRPKSNRLNSDILIRFPAGIQQFPCLGVGGMGEY